MLVVAWGRNEQDEKRTTKELHSEREHRTLVLKVLLRPGYIAGRAATGTCYTKHQGHSMVPTLLCVAGDGQIQSVSCLSHELIEEGSTAARV